MAINATVSGLPDLREALAGIVPKLRKKALRNALAAGAREVRDAARRAAPVLAVPVRNKAGQVIRKTGTVRNAISVRTSKISARAGDVGVFVNVRPAKGARFKTIKGTAAFGLIKTKARVQTRATKRGANSPDDPFYWRFLEFGTSKSPASRFLERGGQAIGIALDKFRAAIGPQIQRLNGGKSVEL